MNTPGEGLAAMAQWIATALAGIGAAAFVVMKMMRSWSADRAGRISDDAQASVIVGLQNEAERLQQQNAHLVGELHKMQQMSIRIAEENIRMQGDIVRLQARIAELVAICDALHASAKHLSEAAHGNNGNA